MMQPCVPHQLMQPCVQLLLQPSASSMPAWSWLRRPHLRPQASQLRTLSRTKHQTRHYLMQQYCNNTVLLTAVVGGMLCKSDKPSIIIIIITHRHAKPSATQCLGSSPTAYGLPGWPGYTQELCWQRSSSPRHFKCAPRHLQACLHSPKRTFHSSGSSLSSLEEEPASRREL